MFAAQPRRIELESGAARAVLADLIARSPNSKKLKVEKMESAATRRGYTHFLDRLDAMAGDRRVDALTRRDIYALQDQLSN